MKALFKKIKQNRFILNVFTLISGTALSQGIMIGSSPILTRIFSPNEFGIYATYIAIITTISVISSLKYELAIMIPKEDEDANALLFISSILVMITSIVVFIIVLFFKNQLINLFPKITSIIWLIPFGILLCGLVQVFNAWVTRNEYFKNLSVSKVILSGGSVISQITLKTTRLLSNGLIVGNIIGNLSALFTLVIYSIKKRTIRIKNISRNDMLRNIKKFDNFPKYQSLSVLLNSLSQNLPILMLSFLYSPEIAGFYALTRRVLETPSRFIGQSIRQVYFQQASKIFSLGKSIKSIFKKTTLNLLFLSVIPFAVLAIISRKLFGFVFGQEWITAGIFAQILMMFTFVAFVNAPAVMSIQILGLQKFSLIYEILLTISRFLSIYISYKIFNNVLITIGFYSMIGFLFNAFLILFTAHKIGKVNYQTAWSRNE